MADWQSQADFPSETSRTKQAVTYLDRAIGCNILEKAMDEYYTKEPKGVQVTLACLSAIGEARIRTIAEQKAVAKSKTFESMFSMVKQHVGLWVAIVLARKYGSSKTYTYRQRQDGPSSTRQVPDYWKPELNWVTSYTPHKIMWMQNEQGEKS